MKTGILFDLDGTLLDTLEDLMDATNYALATYGHPARTLQEIRRVVGNGAENLILKALPEDHKDDLAKTLATFRTYYNAHCQVKTRPYDGVLEALKTLEEKYPIAIVSNKPDVATKRLAKELFGGIPAWGESSDCQRKPAPDMLYKAMQALGADRCIYVGDSEVDVTTAKNAGCKCLAVLWGFRDKQTLMDAGADHFCETPADLLNSLKEMI